MLLPGMFLNLADLLPFWGVPVILALAALSITWLSRGKKNKDVNAEPDVSGAASLKSAQPDAPRAPGAVYLCGHCQRPIDRGVAACPFCGAKICQLCKTVNDADARFCGNCGQQI